MDIYSLSCEKRDLSVKVKKIRQNGLVPAVIYGRHIDSLSVQIKQEDAIKFLQLHFMGSKVLLKIDGEEQLAILKEFQRDPATRKIVHIEFHALTSGEKVKVTIPINYINRDSLAQDTLLQVQMNEIEISALPEFLIDHVTVDVSKYSLGDSVYVSDLKVSKNENIEVLSHQESLMCTITHATKFEEEAPEDEDEPEEAAESAETTEE